MRLCRRARCNLANNHDPTDQDYQDQGVQPVYEPVGSFYRRSVFTPGNDFQLWRCRAAGCLKPFHSYYSSKTRSGATLTRRPPVALVFWKMCQTRTITANDRNVWSILWFYLDFLYLSTLFCKNRDVIVA